MQKKKETCESTSFMISRFQIVFLFLSLSESSQGCSLLSGDQAWFCYDGMFGCQFCLWSKLEEIWDGRVFLRLGQTSERWHLVQNSIRQEKDSKYFFGLGRLLVKRITSSLCLGENYCSKTFKKIPGLDDDFGRSRRISVVANEQTR